MTEQNVALLERLTKDQSGMVCLNKELIKVKAQADEKTYGKSLHRDKHV